MSDFLLSKGSELQEFPWARGLKTGFKERGFVRHIGYNLAPDDPLLFARASFLRWAALTSGRSRVFVSTPLRKAIPVPRHGKVPYLVITSRHEWIERLGLLGVFHEEADESIRGTCRIPVLQAIYWDEEFLSEPMSSVMTAFVVDNHGLPCNHVNIRMATATTLEFKDQMTRVVQMWNHYDEHGIERPTCWDRIMAD